METLYHIYLFTTYRLVEPIEFIARPHGLGLGAMPKPKEPPKKNRIKKPGEEPKKVSVGGEGGRVRRREGGWDGGREGGWG